MLLELTDLKSLALRLNDLPPVVHSGHSLAQLDQLWQRRIEEKVPVQYLAGMTPWRDLKLVVGPGVLIPRPETELIIDLAIAAGNRDPQLTQGICCDLGTGSGAIIVALAREWPGAQCYGIDCSDQALAIAQRNAQRYGLTDRIRFHRGQWWSGLESLRGQVQVMIANPPYIPRGILGTLAPEVQHHEPLLALDGGDSGLEAIAHLVETGAQYLRAGGLWLVEMMMGQGEAVAALLRAQGDYERIQVVNDLAGRDRFVVAYHR